MQTVGAKNGTSEIAVAHRGKEVIVYGCGWVKTADPEYAYLTGSVGVGPTYRAWSSLFKGEGAMWSTAAVSSTGDLGALLLEPTPNEKHMNNRSALLMLFGPASATPLYTYQIDGLGASDPSTVAVSAHASAAGTHTVAAIMGPVTVVIDFDMATHQGTVVYRKSTGDGDAPPVTIAVSPDGRQYLQTQTLTCFTETLKASLLKLDLMASNHLPRTRRQTS